MASRLLLVVAVVAGCAVGLAGATDHIVGANRGWNPNINYTLWSGNQTFFAGDLISFRYQKGTHNVFEVNQTGYDNCTMDGVAGNWTSGKDFIPLPEPGRYFFICGNGGCQTGMKVAITVRPAPRPIVGTQITPAGSDSTASASASASAPAAAAAWLTALALVTTAVA
ncbi:unnamed protein product [Alopecurus aequalis]